MKYGREAYSLQTENFSNVNVEKLLFSFNISMIRRRKRKKICADSSRFTRHYKRFYKFHDYEWILRPKKGIKFIDTMFLFLILDSLLCHHFVIMTSLRGDICRYHLKNGMEQMEIELKELKSLCFCVFGCSCSQVFSLFFL